MKHFVVLVILFFSALPGAEAEGTSVLLHVEAENSLQFTSDQSSLLFQFSDFREGALSDEHSVQYSVTANDVGRMNDLIQVRLDQGFLGTAIQAKGGGYSKTSGNASLISSVPSYTPLTTSDTGLADKVVDSGDGRLLDGTFTVFYRARLSEDQPAGIRQGTLTVSFVDN